MKLVHLIFAFNTGGSETMLVDIVNHQIEHSDVNVVIINKIYNLVKKLHKEKKLPEAFFVSGDEKAIAVLKALNDMKIKIPENISVLGMDNIGRVNVTIRNIDTNEIETHNDVDCHLVMSSS